MSFATKNVYIYVVWELVKRYGDASKKIQMTHKLKLIFYYVCFVDFHFVCVV